MMDQLTSDIPVISECLEWFKYEYGHLIDLVIDTVPNFPKSIQAKFFESKRYNLYRDGTPDFITIEYGKSTVYVARMSTVTGITMSSFGLEGDRLNLTDFQKRMTKEIPQPWDRIPKK